MGQDVVMAHVASKGYLDLMANLREAGGLYWRLAPLLLPGQHWESYSSQTNRSVGFHTIIFNGDVRERRTCCSSVLNA